MTKEEEKEDGVKKAIIKALSDKIVQELNIKKELESHKIVLDQQGNIKVNENTEVWEALKLLINELAEKRLAFGIAMKEEPEKW